MPTWISNEEIHGPIPNAEYNGLQVWGSYNNTLIIESNYMPRYYAAVIATGGPNSDSNPVGFREHINPTYQGLRHIPGRGPYPIQESFFARGFGTGTRHRAHRSSHRSRRTSTTPRRRLRRKHGSLHAVTRAVS